MGETFWEVAKLMATNIPEMAISFLGMVIAFASWSKLPRPALLSFLGFALVLGANIAFWAFFLWYYGIAETRLPWDGEMLSLGSQAARSLLTAGGYLLLIWAIYASRKPIAPVPPMALANGAR